MDKLLSMDAPFKFKLLNKLITNLDKTSKLVHIVDDRRGVMVLSLSTDGITPSNTDTSIRPTAAGYEVILSKQGSKLNEDAINAFMYTDNPTDAYMENEARSLAGLPHAINKSGGRGHILEDDPLNHFMNSASTWGKNDPFV